MKNSETWFATLSFMLMQSSGIYFLRTEIQRTPKLKTFIKRFKQVNIYLKCSFRSYFIDLSKFLFSCLHLINLEHLLNNLIVLSI